MSTSNTTSKTRAPAARTAPNKRSPRRVPILAIAMAAVAAVVLAAVVFGGGSTGETGDPTVTGEPLPLFVAGQLDAAIGLAAPTVTGEDFQGGTVEIRPGEGPMAIAFLAHWCPHCQAEVVEIQGWLDGGGGVDGVELLSVATATDSARDNYPPSDWLNAEGWTPDVVVDDVDGSVMDAFGGNAFPFWVFLDGAGNVVARSAGALDLPTLEGLMEATAN